MTQLSLVIIQFSYITTEGSGIRSSSPDPNSRHPNLSTAKVIYPMTVIRSHFLVGLLRIRVRMIYRTGVIRIGDSSLAENTFYSRVLLNVPFQLTRKYSPETTLRLQRLSKSGM